MKLLTILIILLTFNLSLFSQGETCADAEVITINNTYTSDGPSSGAGCNTCPGDAVNADWFKFTPTESTSISISSCIDGQDTHFFVYEGGCGSLTQVAANDDYGCGVGTNFASYAELSVEGGVEYHIEWIDHWANAEFDFIIQEIACPSPTNLSFNTLTDQGVTVNWNTVNDGAGFTIEYGEFGFSPGDGTEITGIIGTDGPSVSITDLTPNTSYELYLTENCALGDVTTGSINFVTFANLASNDLCMNATEIACGESLTGSTINATMDMGAITCGPVQVNANGVWYHFIGVDGMITASTCNGIEYDTRMTVYQGSCSDLVCVAANDDDLNCAGFASTTHFPATAGTDYWILIHGFEGVSGNFTLNISCGEVCTPVPNNGACSSAIAVTPSTGCVPISSTNECASINLFNPECSDFQETQDVWYSFNSGDLTSVGISINNLTASEMGFVIYENCLDASLICFEEPDSMDVFGVTPDTEYFIQFFSPFNDAGTFEFCLRDDVCEGASGITVSSITETSAEINWTTANAGSGFIVEWGEAGFAQGSGTTISGTLGEDGPPVTISGLEGGTLYEYFVTESCEFGEVISGPLSFNTDGAAPDNDECINAVSINACAEVIAGTTINASISTDAPECDGVPSTSPGVWYVMTVSSESNYTVSTCNDANFDTKISLYTGPCDDLVCIAANDDNPSCADGTSEITFSGIDGEVWVLVHGFGSASGDFNLTTSCIDGISSIGKKDFKLFPNPNDGVFKIEYGNVAFKNALDLNVYNLQGQLIYQDKNLSIQTDGLITINLSGITNGIYTVILSDGTRRIREKLVIE